MKKTNTKMIVMVGMFAAVLAVLSQISIPMPSGVPVTLQTFAVALTGFVLGWKYGLMATGVYILVGAIGVPVFSGFSGGLGVLVGKTGGFIWGFLFMAGLCGVRYVVKNKVVSMICGMVGLAICHILGILQFQFLAEMGFTEAALLVSVPYLLKDVISVVLAYIAAEILERSFRAANISLYEKRA
ncbi:MAG: biotin transporter BioY [Lachnospiraceae bacterium]|nr:biotin transporter BioY [Robinsoniella sp.]MDY3766464.1 biotin transporter BioY [Lachnospiraceae bacterium]